MADPKLILGFREPDIDTNRPFVEGSVMVEGFELEITSYRGPESVDAWDASFRGLMQSKGKGDHPFVSIPAFPNRKFRLSYIFVNSAAGIDSPRDLEGKRVFVNGTAGIWARGALLNYYGVDIARVDWFMRGAQAKSLASGVNVHALPQLSEPIGQTLDTMLVNGELDAVILPSILPSITARDPRLRRLFPDFKIEEQNYFKATGIFPISHMVTLKQEFVDRHPNAPVALLKAYRQARDVAFRGVEGPSLEHLVISWATALLEEQRALMGENYWAYNIENNQRPLEAMMLFAHQLGVTPTKLDYESFFDPEAAALPGV